MVSRCAKYGYTCPAMQRLLFELGGHLVRLSANICQLHRPNTIPIFCAAVCRDYRLRTYIGIAFKFLYCALVHPLVQHAFHLFKCILRDCASICHNPKRHRRFPFGNGWLNIGIFIKYKPIALIKSDASAG